MNTKEKKLIKDRSDYLISEFRDINLENPAELVTKTNQFFENFKDILEDKFFEDSITHAEYLSTGEQITIAVLNKLFDISTKYKSVLPIDEEYISKKSAEADDTKKTALNTRLELKKNQEADVKQMISEVEEALTQLAELTVNVANISDTSKEANLENLRNQMKTLANNTNLYLPEKGL